MPTRSVSAAVLAVATALPLLVAAPSALAEPNIKPGRWETTATTTLKSPQFNMPPMTQTTTDCVSLEDIETGQAFLEDNDSCEIANHEIRDDGMDLSMTCSQGDEGGTMTMDASFKFNGETSSGTMKGKLMGSMGEMDMTMEMASKRIGDC